MKSPKDWELMSQKKDIEEIKYILNQNINKRENILKKGIASVIVSIISSFIATFLSSWMDNNDKVILIYIYILVIILVIILSLIPFIKDIIHFFSRTEKCSKKNRIEQVDLFDNDVIYNIMLSNKYYDLCNQKEISVEEKNFFISESKYYIKKSIHQMKSIRTYSVSNVPGDCIFGENKKIEVNRIKTALQFIESILHKINDTNFSSSLDDDINIIKQQVGIPNGTTEASS